MARKEGASGSMREDSAMTSENTLSTSSSFVVVVVVGRWNVQAKFRCVRPIERLVSHLCPT